MFRNSGKKIMGFVNFVFYLNLVLAILAVVGGAIFVQMEYESVKWTVLAAVGGLVAAALYMVVVFLSLLCLYAFGELVQSSVDSRRILSEMQHSIERYSPQNFREPIQVTSITRNKPTIAERKVSTPAAHAASAPVAPVVSAPAVPVASVTPAAPAAESVGVTETIGSPAKEEPVRPSFSMDYSAAAGAPGFSTGDHAPRPLFCTKCGAKHEPDTPNCRYCGTPLN